MRVQAGPLRYAASPRGHVAYRVVGDHGPLVVLLPTMTAATEAYFDLPVANEFLARLSSATRVVLLDRRGTGSSDPLQADEHPDAVAHAHDVAAVLRSLDDEPALLVGESYDGGPTALTVAAHHPDVVGHVLVLNTPLRPVDVGVDRDELVDAVLTGASTDTLPVLNASTEGDAAFLAWSDDAGRATPPSVARRLWERMLAYDLDDVLPLVTVPTTIVRTGHWSAPDDGVDAVAARLADATVVDLPRVDTVLFLGDNERVLDLIVHTATGGHHALPARRRLLAVLFTDLVDSTTRAAAVGDAAWAQLLDTHDRVAERLLHDHEGRLVKHTGDGLLATFLLPSDAVAAGRSLVASLAAEGLPARAGVHVGEVEVRGEDIGGLSVHVASRIGGVAGPGEVLCSETVRVTTLGSGLQLEPAGSHELRGVAGTWTLYRAG